MAVQMDVFQKREPVYVDYPFEDVAFRWDSGKVYRKFYKGHEQQIRESNDLFRQAVLSGEQITKAEYDKR